VFKEHAQCEKVCRLKGQTGEGSSPEERRRSLVIRESESDGAELRDAFKDKKNRQTQEMKHSQNLINTSTNPVHNQNDLNLNLKVFLPLMFDVTQTELASSSPSEHKVHTQGGENRRTQL